MCFINSILCFLKASIIPNVKVVPNDIFKFGGERVNFIQSYFITTYIITLCNIVSRLTRLSTDDHHKTFCLLVLFSPMKCVDKDIVFAKWLALIGEAINFNLYNIDKQSAPYHHTVLCFWEPLGDAPVTLTPILTQEAPVICPDNGTILKVIRAIPLKPLSCG